MEKNIANELKELDIEMGRKMFSIAKKSNIELPPSPLQAKIIDFLLMHQGEDVCQKDLENTLNVSKATISATLQTMENNGIIKRVTSKKDARSKTIVLTENSQKVHHDMKQLFDKLNAELTKGFSKGEKELLFHLIEKLKYNIKNE